MGHRTSRHQPTAPGVQQPDQRYNADEQQITKEQSRKIKNKRAAKCNRKGQTEAKASTTCHPEKVINEQATISLSEQQRQSLDVSQATRPIGIPSATIVHQQQFQSVSSAGSVVITIRMLKMEPNDLNEFVQQHHIQQQQQQQQFQHTNSHDERNTINASSSNNSSSNSRSSNSNSNTSTIGLNPSSTVLPHQFNSQLSSSNMLKANTNSIQLNDLNHSVHALNNNTFDVINNSNVNNKLVNSFSLPSKHLICDIPNSSNVSSLLSNVIGQNVNGFSDGVTLPTTLTALNGSPDIETTMKNISLMEQIPLNNNDFIDGDNNHANVRTTNHRPSELLDRNSILSTTSSVASEPGKISSSNNVQESPQECEHEHAIVTHCAHCQKKKKSHPKCCKNCNKEGKSKKSNSWSLRFSCAKLKRTPSSASTVCSTPTTAGTLSTVATTTTASISQSSCSATRTSPSTALVPMNSIASDCIPESVINATAQAVQVLTTSNPTSTIASMTTAANPINTSTTLLLDNSALCNGSNVIVVSMNQQPPQPLLDFTRFNADDYPIEDCDKKARLQRALEIEEGVEPPPGFTPSSPLSSTTATTESTSTTPPVNNSTEKAAETPHWHMLCSNDAALRFMLPNWLQNPDDIPRIHSQVDYIHCLVPDLMRITSCSFYWGKMDRYEAERLLEGKPEGTFLLRDSAQEEFLFSVSFRKYGRSLHARIEQFNHQFSFDCHDPGVYTSSTVTGLLEHYKDPACVMFFEPALTLPLNRNFVFSLQQLCRATIVSHTTYDGINDICLPKKVKAYLKEYHYKQRVRVKRFDEPFYTSS